MDINSPILYTPKKGWINDPNGLVFANGTYHLFYQHNASADEWGNICWGHATGTDLVSWTDKGVGVPYNQDTKVMAFSGSAVYDTLNSSGFGTVTNPPIVAMFTSFYSKEARLADGTIIKEGTQNQSLAYSTDKGATFKFYSANPVIRLPPKKYEQEYKDFRDPKMFWYAPQNKWVLVTVLSKLRKAIFWSSKNLKDWTFMSEFNYPNIPDAIWECPDLFQLDTPTPGMKKWVLLISTNPGGLAGGSGMHYYVGEFDGLKFTADNFDANYSIRWLDFGSDFYAGVTWNNTGNQRFLIAWINNWDYALKITKSYKGGLGFVRELSLIKVGTNFKLSQKPAKNLEKLRKEKMVYSLEAVKKGIDLLKNKTYELLVEMTDADKTDFSFIIEDNKKKLEVEMGCKNDADLIFVKKISQDPIDEGNYVYHTAEYLTTNQEQFRIFIDNNTVTLFNGKGDVVFTELLRSNADQRRFHLTPESKVQVTATRWLLSLT